MRLETTKARVSLVGLGYRWQAGDTRKADKKRADMLSPQDSLISLERQVLYSKLLTSISKIRGIPASAQSSRRLLSLWLIPLSDICRLKHQASPPSPSLPFAAPAPSHGFCQKGHLRHFASHASPSSGFSLSIFSVLLPVVPLPLEPRPSSGIPRIVVDPFPPSAPRSTV